MPDIKNNIKVIYNALSKEGYNDLGSEQEFAESMADENNRKLVYNTLKGKEFADVKDYDSFSNMVYQQPRAGQQQEEEMKPVEPAKIDPRFVAPNVGKPTDAQPIMKSVQQDTGFSAPQDYNSQNAFLSNVDKDYNVASHIPDAQQPIKMYGADSNLGEVIDNLYTVYDEAYKKDNPKKIAEAANMARSMGLDNEQAEKALTLVHGLYSQNVANNIADYMYSRMNNGDPLYALKEVYYNKDFQKKLKDTTTRLGLDNTQGFVEYYLKPALQRKLENERGFTDTVNFGVQSGSDDVAKNTEVFEKRKAEEDLLQKQVDAMNAEGKRIEEKGQQMYDPNYKNRPWWADLIPVEGGGRSAYDEAEGIKRNPEAEELMRTGQAMQRMSDDAQAAISEDNILRTRKTDGLTNQIKNAFGRILRGGAKTATDIRTWDFGFTDLKDATVIKAAADAYASNRATAAQKALLNAVALKNAVMGKHGDSLGGLYGAAGTTIQMVPFMAQFAFSPVKGVGPAAQKYCRTQLEKAFGKYATEAVGKFVIKSGELAGRFVGDVAQGAAMTTIFNMPAVAADTHKRMTGDLEAATDSKGNIVYSGKRTNVKSGGRAFAEAFTAQTIENQSELVGEYFAPLQDFIQKGAIKALDKWGLSKTKDFLTGINNKQIMKGFNRFTKKTEWNKLLGETGEEFIGNIENAATVGDLNFKLDPDDDNSVFSKKVNTDIILGVGLGCGIISGARVGSYIRNNRKLNTAINDADTHADVIFGTDRWQQIKSEIDNAPDDKAGNLLQSYINNAKLNNEQKQTIVDYTVNTYIKRGNDISHLKNAIEDNISSEQQEVQSAYENGQNARDAQMNEVKTSLDEAEKHATELLGEDELNALDGVEDVDAFKESNAYKSYSEEQREAALKYIIARTAYNGMINRVQDEIKAAVNKANAEIDNLTHKDSGTIIRATLKNGDQEVYVVSGNVAMSPDGKSIDTEKSDSDIVVYNTESGKKEMLNIKDLQSVDTPIDAATYKADSAAETTQQIAETEAAKIDGVRNFHYNDTVKVQDKDGNLIDGSVQDVTPDGVIVVSDAYPGGKTYTAAELTAMQPQPQTVAENATVEQQAEEAVADNESNEAPAEEKGEANSPQSEATPQEETAEPQQQAVEPQQQAIPTDDKGSLLYHEVPVERTIEDLYDGSLDDTEITDFISANIEAAQKEYNSVVKKAPKIGTDKARYLQEKKAYQEEVDKAKAKVDYWQAVENERQRITHTSPEELKNAEDELSGEAARKDYRGITAGDEENTTSVEDLVRDFLGGAKITPEDFRKETGLSISEQKKFVGMISKQGKTIARLGEELADYDEWNLGGRFFGGDSNAARGAIIDVLLSSRTRGDFKQQDATEEEERYIEAVEQQREQWYYENYHMTYEEYLQYREIVLPELLRKYANFAPDILYPQFVASFEDAYVAEHSQTNNTENNEQQRNDTTTEEPTTTPGNTVLQTEETNNSRGDSQSEEQPTEVPTGVRSSNENGTLPQSTPTEVDKEPLSEEAAQSLITSMEENAIEDPEIRLTPKTWLETFGINNSIDTPIGKVRMGENQYAKLQDKKRTSEFGMVSLTLSDPDVIFVEPSKAKGEDVAERNFSYVFAKTFKRNGNKVKYYTSVTVSIDGLEISVSSHFVNPNKMLNKLMEFNREYTKETLFSNSSEMRLAEHQSDVPDLLPTQENNVSSDSKVTQSSQTKQEKENKFSPTPRKDGESITDYAERVAEEHKAQRTRKEEEAKVDTNPTDAQKEAGNYRKGHIKVDGLDITIEQPKGSIRRGTDANGKQWESEMHNTYGYIRGTESVDGDHIDIFLSDNPTEGNVFVVDQINKDGSFDEHKVMYGFSDMESARQAYLSNYEEGWQGLGNITEVSKENFKAWIDSSKRKTKPFAEYTSVKTQDDTQAQKPTEIPRLTEKEKREQRKQELRNKIKAKLRGQLNVGVDPELFMMGVELASMEIEDGVRKFADFTKKMIAEIGDEIRPYLKSIYNGARDLPGMEELSEEMTPYEEVKAFNIATIGDKGEEVKPSVFDTAEQINNEQTVERSAKEEVKNTVETQDVDSEAYSITKQHNNKKDIDIWVVRGKERTDSDAFKERKQVAKKHNGYYSSFRGVNGFVFNTPEDAQSFADDVFNTTTNTQQAEKNTQTDSTEVRDKSNPDIESYLAEQLNSIAKDKTIQQIVNPATGNSEEVIRKSVAKELQDFVIDNYTDYSDPKVKALLDYVIGDKSLSKEENKKNLDRIIDALIDRTRSVLKADEGATEFHGGERVFSLKHNAYKHILAAFHNSDGKTEYYKFSDGTTAKANEVQKNEPEKNLKEENSQPNEKQSTADVKESLTKKKTEAKAKEANNKTVSSHAEGNLFDTDTAPTESLTNKEKENEVHLSNGETATKRERGHEPRQNEPMGESKQNEAQRPDGRRMDRRDTAHISTDTERGGGVPNVSKGKQRLNSNNNHGERGVDYAPTSIDARIEANIQAIELAKKLTENGEKATPQQMEILRKFSGWGGLGKAFNENPNGAYGEINKTPRILKELLGEEAYNNAIESANSSYYTPTHIIDTLWDIAENLGFKGGRILEGSAGIGNIIAQIPTHINENSNIHAVEKDPTAGSILSLLYPDAKVDIQGFEETSIPNGSIDLAITNVPFVTGLRVWDTTSDKDLSKKFHDIHNFCIAKNIRKLREGGTGIFISSNGTLDNSQQIRNWVVNDGNADFIGAFRLNNKTFLGTSVTSDIIVVRKRVDGKKSAKAIDVSEVSGERIAEFNTGEVKNVKGKMIPVIKDLPMDYNKYFIEHPEKMAGVMEFAFEHGDTYRPTTKQLYPTKDKPQDKLLEEFVNSLSIDTEEQAQNVDNEQGINNSIYEELGSDVKEGSMVVSNGELCVAQYGQAVPLKLNANKVKGHTKQECFKSYTDIKQALNDVLAYETQNADDKGLQPLLDKLNKAYDDFVNTYGHLNKNTSISFLRNDIDFSNILALETYKEENDENNNRVKVYGKTDVFSKRVVTKETEPKPDNVKDGVIVSIYKNGRIDIPYISKQLNMSEDAVKDEIINSGLGFENPVSKEIEVSYKYLSGNVREKLQQAEENNENSEYSNNINALKKVIPANIPAHLIEFNLGSSWVTPKLYEEYIKNKTGLDVTLIPVDGTWVMKAPLYGLAIEQNRSMGVYSKLKGETILGHELIEAAIQNKTITISKTRKDWDGKKETIVDKDATQACNSRIDEIRQDFKDWARGKVQSDVELSQELEKIYNDKFNNYVAPTIPEEFIPERFGGAAQNIKLRPHQAQAVVRGTTQPLILAHEVGTGKTFTLISTAMEMRRLGTARKPMIVVQNATVGQFVASAKALYPNAKILTLENSDRGEDGRRRFYAKIRYNDWDMIVVPQSTFEFIPDSKDRQITFIKDKVDEKLAVLQRMKEANDKGDDFITRRVEKEIAQLQSEIAALIENNESEQREKKATASELKKKEVTKKNTEAKAKEMLDRRTDDVEDFDELGIDALLVDEAHEYKHLGFATAMQRGVKGVDPSYSKKAQSVFLKTQAVLSKNNGRNVIFATGTPISNTAAEIWTFMRYLMPADTMKEYGIYYFDDFVRNFGNIQQMLEFTTSGKFKENNRFAGYINLPELARIWSSVADIVLTRDQKKLKEKIPEIEGGKAQDIYLPQTKSLRSVMKYVKDQLTIFENMSGAEKKENTHIPLTMYGIAKAAAVDARLVDATAEDDVNSKTNEAVRQTLQSLKDTNSYKGTVAIFADVYQNKAFGFNLYEDIKKKLIEKGVPEKEIFVMKPGMTINKKLEIFNKVNSGEIRVILGSTFTLGTGVNIQERLHTLIHLDAPNRPMDYTQRNGRILRQGNIHKEMNKPVRILRFGVEDSLDVTAYQRLKTKGAIADSIMNSKQLIENSMENRELEEEADLFGDTVAQLSGSEYAMFKNQAEKEVRKYESKKRQWEADQTYIHNAKPRLKGQISKAEQLLEDNNASLKAIKETFPNGKFKQITIGKQQFDSIEAMADFIKDYNKKINEESNKLKEKANANYNSQMVVNIDGLEFTIHLELAKETANKGVSLFSKVTRKMYYSQNELGLKNVPIKQGLLRNGIEDILNNVITGHDFAERIDTLKQSIAQYKSDLELILARDGKPFEFKNELETAKQKLEEYTEAMKEELEEKEKKYAAMDSEIKTATNIIGAEEAEDEDSTESKDTKDDILYRTVFGGNSGYVGYSLSKRAAEVKEEGRDIETPTDVEELIQHATQTARSLNLDNVEVVADGSIFKDKKATAKGFYNKRTGKITIIASNHTDIADIEKTVLHEGVAHYGLRKLFGDNFNAFLDTVFAKADIKTRRQIAHLSAKHGWNIRTATEEYLAGMAEDANFEQLKPTTWQRIKRLFGEMMSALGLHHSDVTDNDLRYLLWRSYKNLENGGKRSILDMAEDIAMQYRLKVGNYTDKFTDELNAVNERFNEKLSNLTEENADKVALNLGTPSAILRAAGVENKPMKLYGNKVIKKIKKHGFALEELKDLPKAVANPIAVFNNYKKEGNRSILTELKTKQGNFLVTIDLGKGTEDIDFNIVSSVFGKDSGNIVDWIERGLAVYINKEKALNYLHHSALRAEALSSSRLNSAAKIIKDFHNPKLNSNVLYRSSIDPTATEVLPDARTRYEEETKEPDNIGSVPKTHNFFRRFYKSYIDSMLALKSFTNSVLEATGDKMASHEDTYKAENAMTSKNKTDGEVYNRDYYNPLLTAAQQLCEAVGMDYDALNMYMVAKHGLERNEYMGKRAAQNDENVLKAKKALEDALVAYNENPTSKNEAAVQKAQEKYTKVYDKALEVHTSRDYSGLTELTGKEDVAEAEYEAQKIVDAVETPDAMPKVTAFWSKVNAATKQTLKTGYESGIMTKDTYEHILNMYKYYIPLRGWAEPTADDVYTYYNNRSYEGKPLTKTAKGRTSLAEDPMAIIASMAQRSIIEANRNKMKQTFLNFVLNHPTSLATVGEQWYIINALGEWERSDANIPANATSDEISKIIEEHELEMQTLAETGEAIKQRNGLKLDKRVINGEGAEHTIKVWRGGKEYIIYINGNPAVAQAVNGLTNPDTQGSKLPKWAEIGAAQLKNFLSGVYTSFSPAFVLTNFTRDQLFASQAVYIKYGLKYKRQASKNARNLLFSGALPRLVYKWEHGTLNMNDETERYFDEFMRGGGETGFTALRDIESIKKEVKDAVNGNKANIAKRGWKSFINAVEFANRSAEDFSRFVTFMTSRQQGKNIVDSIYDAKDITVNFNKKGSGEMGSRFMNFAYIFFNAAVQSINNFGTMLKQHPARTMLVISKFGALGFGVPMLNAFLTALCGGGDDDKYWDNMDWVRRNNIVLRIPFLEKTFISIPLPQELRPFYGMGEIAASILFGKETFSSGLQKAVEGFTGLLPIDFTGNGGNLPITLTPTVLQPVAQYMFNTDYFGRKVYNDNENKKFAPGWTKAFSSTPPVLIEATKFLNSLTGGNDVDSGGVNLNPDVINHFVKGYFGGPATFVTQMSSLLYKGFSGDAKEIRWRDVPVASRFVQQLDERSVRSSAQGSYKDFKEETEETEYRLSNYKKQVKMGKMEYAKMITDLIKSPEYQRYKIAKAYKKPMDLLKEALNHIDNTTDKKEVEKALTGLRHYMMETVESEQKGKHAKREEDFNYLGDNLSELNNNLKSSLRSLKRNEEQRLDGEEDDGIEELISEDKETTMRIIREMNKLFKKK